MLEEILPNIFKITVPLPEHSLQSINCYVIVSSQRNLIIDTGWNRLECAEALLDGLEAIGVALSRSDLFLTHVHADHAGLTGLFRHNGAKVYCGQGDLQFMDNYINTSGDKQWSTLRTLAAPHGFSLAELDAAIAAHSGNRYGPDYHRNFITVADNDALVAGNYTFYCVATPGHTPGHTCLYEPINKLLFSGDHVLGAFSTTISQWTLEDHNVADYLDSLDKIYGYAVEKVLPGHWREFSNCRVCIEETKAYHRQRHAEILALFKEGQVLTAYQAASRLSWNKKYNEWVFFSPAKKWNAVGDTVAHLCFLRDQGYLIMLVQQGQVTWQLHKM